MTLRTLLHFRNLDSTADLNDRYVNLIGPGVYNGGEVTPVPSQLAVSLAPWQLVNADGMVTEETSDTVVLQTPADQTTVIAVYAVYVSNGVPIIQTVAVEETAFNLLPDLAHYVVMATVTVPVGASSVLTSYISYSQRQSIDPLTRSPFRGFEDDAGALPLYSNQPGDFYVVVSSGVANLYAWTGTSWQIMTNVVTVAAELANHRANLYTNEKHMTDLEQQAVVGTSGVNASVVIQDLTYTASQIGASGNATSVTYSIGGTAGSETVTVVGSAITVQIQNGVSTALQVKAAIDNFPAASSLVSSQVSGGPSNPQFSQPLTFLTNGAGEQVSATNKLVDNADPRVPTINEAQALPGSNGTPGSGNLYVTQAFPLAIPEEKAFVLPLAQYPLLAADPEAVILLTSDGPVYVGLSALGSANIYFRFYDPTDNREFTTASELTVNCTGVYKDSNLTIELDPSTDPSVDENGFFNNASLYIAFDNLPDTNFRIIYGQGQTLKTLPPGALLRRNVYDAQTTGETVIAIEQIKGRPYTTQPPTDEQNINLRSSQVQLQEYMSAVFNADHVVSNFTNVVGVPAFSEDFVENVGIPTNSTFTNTGIVGFTYASSTGTITYNSSVVLSSVAAGNVFLDGAGNAFTVQSVATNSVVVKTRDGSIPTSIDTTVTLSIHGSIQPDNNPRGINLSTLQCVTGRDRINIRNIAQAINEYHPITNNVAYQVITPVRSQNYGEPRVRLYGGWEVSDIGKRQRVTAMGSARALVTGFFTDLYLLCDFQPTSPVLTIKVDGQLTGTTVDTSRGATAVAFGSTPAPRAKSVALVNGLADGVPHTVEIIVAAGGSLLFYGFDLVRYDIAHALVLPGRAFVQADLYKNDTIQTLINPSIASQERGGVSVRFINRSQVLQSTTSLLTDFDGTLGGPGGTAIPSTVNFTVITGLSKFEYYRAGDVVKLVTASTEEVKQIASIGPAIGQIVFTTVVTSNGAAALIHLASTQGDPIDPTQEYVRYLPTDFGLGIVNDPITDFSSPTSSTQNRMFTMEDGCTTMAGQGLGFTNTNIESTNYALSLPNTSSTLFIRALCSRMDILVPNLSACTLNVSIDGCPAFPINIAGIGLIRVTLLVNARYQTHEVLITNSQGLTISGIILHEPALFPAIQGAALGTQDLIASYASGHNSNGALIPIGTVGLDPTLTEGRFFSGTGAGSPWTDVQDFVNAPVTGRYVSTSQVGAYFEYEFFGGGFEIEYSAGSDRGQALIEINGLVANNTNFSATFRNINVSTGVVDMYASGVSRQRFGISSLPYGKYVMRILVQNPAQKNSSSSGYNINVATIYAPNTSGFSSVTPLQDYTQEFAIGQDTVRDSRQFESGATQPIILTQVQQVLAYPRDGSYSVGFESDDDFIATGTNDQAVIIAALNAAAASPGVIPHGPGNSVNYVESRIIRKVWIKPAPLPGGYGISSVISVPTGLEVEGMGFPRLTNDGAGTTCFQVSGPKVRIKGLDFSGFTIDIDAQSNAGVSMLSNRNMTPANMVVGDTIIGQTDAQAVVGTSADLLAGVATFTDLTAALTAVPANSKIIILSGYTSAGAVTVSKTVNIFGAGNNSIITGNLTVSANNCIIENLQVTGSLSVSGNNNVIESTSLGGTSVTLTGSSNILGNLWIPSVTTFSDSGTGNQYQFNPSKGNRQITASATLTSIDYYILVNAASGPVTVTLPLSTTSISKQIRVQKIDTTTNAVTIVPNAAENLNGQGSGSATPFSFDTYPATITLETLATSVSGWSGWIVT